MGTSENLIKNIKGTDMDSTSKELELCVTIKKNTTKKHQLEKSRFGHH